jgi:hypothetical protein
MKRVFVVLSISMLFGLVCGVRGSGSVILISDLDQSNIGSYNFGSIILLAVPLQTGSSPISVQRIDLLMQQYQQVADEPFVDIYTDNGSFLPAVQVPGATFSPQLPLTSTMGINAFDPSSSVTLQANTTYDIVVGAPILDGYWAWGLVSGTGEVGPGGDILPHASEERDQSWEPLVSGTTFGFDLVGTVVPEPSTISLFALGAFVLRKRGGWQKCLHAIRSTTMVPSG